LPLFTYNLFSPYFDGQAHRKDVVIDIPDSYPSTVVKITEIENIFQFIVDKTEFWKLIPVCYITSEQPGSILSNAGKTKINNARKLTPQTILSSDFS
jgi:hypothetical protein